MAGIHKFHTARSYFRILAGIWNFFAEYLQMLGATVHSLVTQTTWLPG